MVRAEYNVKADQFILEEFPEKLDLDVAIIGAGPNGLIAGAYLAKAGLRVGIFEKRQEIGGGLATEEILFPGYYSNPHAFYHMMVDYMPLFKDFNLGIHGITFIKPNAQFGIIFRDKKSLLLCKYLQDSKDSIAKFSQADADRFGQLMRQWRTIIDKIIAPGTYSKPLTPVDMIERFEATPLGKKVLALTEKSPVEIIDENFENDQIKTALLYAACMWGLDPTESGLGFMVPLMIDRAMNKAQCYGGSHKLAGALSREILRNGGVVLDNAEVTAIEQEDGRVSGIRLFDGRSISVKAVISSLPPPITFGHMLQNVPVELKEVSKEWIWDKWSFYTLSVATYEGPVYDTDDPWINDALMVVMGFDSSDDVINYFKGAMKSKLPNVLGGHASVETKYDPTLSRVPGNHVSFFQTHVPYEVQNGWEDHKKDFTKKLLELWRSYARNLGESEIIMSSSESPRDIEVRLASMVKGSIKHGDYDPLQMGSFRPHDSCIGGKTPVEGLYLCGASSYPGGLIIGGPAYIAINTIADDLSISRWWKTPNYIKEYEERYLYEN
jgi:phytoene dehydrogenase-like protein